MAAKQEPSESMTVEIELENGEVVMCEVITILTVAGKDYIALLPKGQERFSLAKVYKMVDTWP